MATKEEDHGDDKMEMDGDDFFQIKKTSFDTAEELDMGGDPVDPEAGGNDEGGGDVQKFCSSDPESARAAALAAKEALKRKFDEQYDDLESSKLDFYTEKKDEMARQLALNRAEFEGIDTESRAMVEGYRPGSYVRIELANDLAELIVNFASSMGSSQPKKASDTSKFV